MQAMGRFADGMSARTHSVSLEFQEHDLVLTSADGAVWRWPYASIRRRPAEGSGNKPILSAVAMPEARLALDDPSTLAIILADRCPNLDAMIRPDRRILLSVGAWAAGGVLLMVVGYFGLPRLASSLAGMFPQSWEARLGDRAERSFETILTAKPCPPGDGDPAMAALVARLATAAGLAHAPDTLILRHALVNAFALPGDRIVITTGMIAYLQTSDELAGLLAHEIGHLQRRDPVTLLIDQAGWEALQTIVFGMNSTGQFGQTLLTLSYSRGVEARADQSAVVTLAAAHIESSGFEHVMRRFAKRGDAMLPYLASHPPSVERADAIAAAGKHGDPAMSADNWHRIRTNAIACAMMPKSAL